MLTFEDWSRDEVRTVLITLALIMSFGLNMSESTMFELNSASPPDFGLN